MTIAHPELEGIGKYEYGWSDVDTAGANSRRGLNDSQRHETTRTVLNDP